MHDEGRGRSARQPAINIPGVVIGLIGAFVAAHLARLYLFDEADFLLRYALIPARYTVEGYPGGIGAMVWTPLTYAFIHADWTHLAVNSLWLAVFGTAMGRRFGTARLLLFGAVCAVAGAPAHYLGNAGDTAPVVGASAAVSGMMAGACRFMFSAPRAVLVYGPHGAMVVHRQPALSLIGMFRNPRALAFLAIWFVLNLGMGLGSAEFLTGGVEIAWEAHIGGFLAGLLLFPLFDPVPTTAGAPPPPRAPAA